MLILTIWPLFALICLGFVLARRDFPSAEFWPAAERLTYFILFPALLVVSLSDAPVRDPAILRLGGASVAVIAVAVAVMVVLRRIRPMPAARFGPSVQGIIRFNTYLGLAIVGSLTGPEGLSRAAVFLAVSVPVVNVISIMALSDDSPLRHPGLLIRSILRNPLIIACLLGFALSLTGIGLPLGLDRFFELMGRASLPLGLLCVGAALRPATLRLDLRALAGVGALRLLAMPVLAALCARVFALDPVSAQVLVIFCAIPTATTAYVLTQQLGGDGRFMAGIITAQTLAAVATIPAVLWVLG